MLWKSWFSAMVWGSLLVRFFLSLLLVAGPEGDTGDISFVYEGIKGYFANLSNGSTNTSDNDNSLKMKADDIIDEEAE